MFIENIKIWTTLTLSIYWIPPIKVKIGENVHTCFATTLIRWVRLRETLFCTNTHGSLQTWIELRTINWIKLRRTSKPFCDIEAEPNHSLCCYIFSVAPLNPCLNQTSLVRLWRKRPDVLKFHCLNSFKVPLVDTTYFTN